MAESAEQSDRFAMLETLREELVAKLVNQRAVVDALYERYGERGAGSRVVGPAVPSSQVKLVRTRLRAVLRAAEHLSEAVYPRPPV